MGLIIALLVLLILLLPVIITFWILGCVGLYTLAKRRGINNPWLAWIPVADRYIIGALSDQYTYTATGNVHRLRIVAPLLQIVSLLIISPAFSQLGFYGSLVALASMVLYFFCLYQIYRSCRPNSAVLMLVLSILLIFMPSIFLFANRKSDEGLLMYASTAQSTNEENIYGQ